MRRQPDGRAAQHAVRRAVVTATALLAPGLAAGPADRRSGNVGQMSAAGVWTTYGRFSITPFGAFAFSDRPRPEDP